MEHHTHRLVACALYSCKPDYDDEDEPALEHWRATVIHISQVFALNAQVEGSVFDTGEFLNMAGVSGGHRVARLADSDSAADIIEASRVPAFVRKQAD
jgi:hypothetical protein